MLNSAQKAPQGNKEKEIKEFLNSPFFVAIIVGVFSILAAIISIMYTNKVKNELKVYFQQQISLSQKQETTINLAPTPTPGDTNKQNEKNTIKSFNSDDWVFAKGTNPNKEGYYCPTKPAFPSWAMWTKKKYKADEDVSITFSLMDNSNNGTNPTLFISYGDKTNEAPERFYRFNIFDGDLNTIRLLYGREEKTVQTERTLDEAPLDKDKFITFTISPVFLNKKSSLLMLNPVVSEQGYNFETKKEFKIELPFSSSENQGDGFQYGLGVSKGDCFKVMSSSL